MPRLFIVLLIFDHDLRDVYFILSSLINLKMLFVFT